MVLLFLGMIFQSPENDPDVSTWSEQLRQLVDTQQVDVTPFTLRLNYDYWNYRMQVLIYSVQISMF